MLRHRAFRCRPHGDVAEHGPAFSEREEELLRLRGIAPGPRKARLLLKELLLEWLAAEGRPALPQELEILPHAGGSGPPVLEVPAAHRMPGCRVHISLSHSGSHAAALLVVEDDGPEGQA